MRPIVILAVLGLLAGCKQRAYDAGSWTASADDVTPGELPAFRARLGVKLGEDLTVERLVPVSPGCVLGLRVGDRITALNGQKIATPGELETAAEANLAGEFAPWCLEVDRAGAALALPSGCDFEARADTRATRDYVCDPLSMTQCGQLPAACSGL